MWEAILASVAGVIAIVGWWLKNRAKTRREKEDEEIEERRSLRDGDIDSWIHRR